MICRRRAPLSTFFISPNGVFGSFLEALHIVHILLFVEKPAVTGFIDEVKRGIGRIVLVNVVLEVEEGVDSLVSGFAYGPECFETVNMV